MVTPIPPSGTTDTTDLPPTSLRNNDTTTTTNGTRDGVSKKRPLSPSDPSDGNPRTDDPRRASGRAGNPTDDSSQPPTPKRRRKCPQKSSILISLPLSVVADLGVAMRRSRKKRAGRIRRWLAEVDGGNGGESSAACGGGAGKEKNAEFRLRSDNDGENNAEGEEEGEGSISSSEKKSPLNFSDDESVSAPKREQYSSVLDYLEAKYVRGVVIADYDENGMRVKKKPPGKQSAQSEEGGETKGGEGEGDEGDYDSDQDDNRSTYGDNDGFIDDSLLHEEVADQVFASDAYARTKIEEEAAARKRKVMERRELEAEGEEEEELSEVEDFDDGFFVNVGELEMAEGWRGDEEVVISPVKRKPGRPKKGEEDGEVEPKKKRKMDKESAEPKKKKMKEGEAKKKEMNDKLAPKKKEDKSKAEKKPTPVKKKNSAPSEPNKQSPPSPPRSPVKKPNKEEPQTPKSIADNLSRLVKRRFNVCVKMIRELTPKQLPRKTKVKCNAKISVSIPADKGIGDYIMFTNPHIPGQKLKVQVPAKANMETRTFLATVPVPKQLAPEPRENDIPKELKEALFSYSTAYDDWVNAKAVYISSLPEADREEFKPTAEKLKKFDDIITEFPNNLATPIDLSYIRLLVRRLRSNKAKAEKRTAPAKAQPITAKENTAVVKLDTPRKGIDFHSVVFDRTKFISS